MRDGEFAGLRQPGQKVCVRNSKSRESTSHAHFGAIKPRLGAVVVPVMAVMTVVGLRKSRSADEHDHGEQQCLLHDGMIATKASASPYIFGVYGAEPCIEVGSSPYLPIDSNRPAPAVETKKGERPQ